MVVTSTVPAAVPWLSSIRLGLRRAAGAAANLTQFGLGLALAYRAAGRADDALATIEQALMDADAYDERYVELSCTVCVASCSVS